MSDIKLHSMVVCYCGSWGSVSAIFPKEDEETIYIVHFAHKTTEISGGGYHSTSLIPLDEAARLLYVN